MAGIPQTNKDDELINVKNLTPNEIDVFEKLAKENLIKRNDEIHSMANSLNNLEEAGILQECLKKYNVSEKSAELIKAESFDIGIQEAKQGISKDDNLANILNSIGKINEEDRISLLNELAKKNELQTIGFNLEKAREDMKIIDQCVQQPPSDELKL